MFDRSLFRHVADSDPAERVAMFLDPIDAGLVPGWYAAPESFRQFIRLLVAFETGQPVKTLRSGAPKV